MSCTRRARFFICLPTTVGAIFQFVICDKDEVIAKRPSFEQYFAWGNGDQNRQTILSSEIRFLFGALNSGIDCMHHAVLCGN